MMEKLTNCVACCSEIDGQRFLMNTIHEEVASPITVILNWKGKP
jgi:hypothetical protein